MSDEKARMWVDKLISDQKARPLYYTLERVRQAVVDGEALAASGDIGVMTPSATCEDVERIAAAMQSLIASEKRDAAEQSALFLREYIASNDPLSHAGQKAHTALDVLMRALSEGS